MPTKTRIDGVSARFLVDALETGVVKVAHSPEFGPSWSYHTVVAGAGVRVLAGTAEALVDAIEEMRLSLVEDISYDA